mgnify:CR=1
MQKIFSIRELLENEFFSFTSQRYKDCRRICLKTHKNNKKPAKTTGLMWWEEVDSNYRSQ